MTLQEFQGYTAFSVEYLIHLLPVLLLTLGGLSMLTLELFLPKGKASLYSNMKRWISSLFFLSAASAAFILFWASNQDLWLFGQLVQVSPFAHFATILFSLLGLLTVLIGQDFHTQSENSAEYLALLFFSTLGMCMMILAADLILLFVSLELMSFCIYILIASKQVKSIFVEGAMKYFLLGSLASVFLLLGIALIFGAYGTTVFAHIIEAQTTLHPALLNLGLIVFSAGIAFKFGLIPFHMYIPDAYQAAPSQITSFMAVGVKIAIFMAAIRLMLILVQPDPLLLYALFYPLFLLTVILSNFMALRQFNIKRMLAYSSIAHAGYLAIGLLPLTQTGNQVWLDSIQAIVFYLVAYGIATVGLFALLCALEEASGVDQLNFNHLIGFSKQSPLGALLFFVLFVSLAGLPVSAGFVGKYLVFAHAVRSGEVFITLAAIIGSMVSLYYYFRIPINAYLVERKEGDPGGLIFRKPLTMNLPFAVATLCGFLSVLLGVMPQDWLSAISRAVFQGF